jgi:hypothetical protein
VGSDGQAARTTSVINMTLVWCDVMLIRDGGDVEARFLPVPQEAQQEARLPPTILVELVSLWVAGGARYFATTPIA